MPLNKTPHIRQLEAWLGAALPEAYARFLESHEECLVGEQVVLYDAQSLLERNATYETMVYCPGHLTIGDDGGGRALVIPLNAPLQRVYLVSHGDMTPEGFEAIDADFHAWLEAGCPIDD